MNLELIAHNIIALTVVTFICKLIYVSIRYKSILFKKELIKSFQFSLVVNATVLLLQFLGYNVNIKVLDFSKNGGIIVGSNRDTDRTL